MCRHGAGFPCLISAKVHVTVRHHLYEENPQESGGKPHLSLSNLAPYTNSGRHCEGEGPGLSFPLRKMDTYIAGQPGSH